MAFCIDFKSNKSSHRKQDEFYGPEAVGNVIEKSDYICVTAALTPETNGMVGAAELAKAKPSAGTVIIKRTAAALVSLLITHTLL